MRKVQRTNTTRCVTSRNHTVGAPRCITNTTTTKAFMWVSVASGSLVRDGTKSGVIGSTCAVGNMLESTERGEWESNV